MIFYTKLDILFEIFWDLAISLPFAIPLRGVVDVELLARFMNASKAAGAQRVAKKKKKSYHCITPSVNNIQWQLILMEMPVTQYSV